MQQSWNASNIMTFYKMLNDIDSITCDESKYGEVNLDNYKNLDSGNSSMHYTFINNGCRMVLQIHKNGHRKGKVDVVQGHPENDQALSDLLLLFNELPCFTDYHLNKFLIFYTILHNYVSLIDTDEFEVFCITINNINIWSPASENGDWEIAIPEACPVSEVEKALWFIDQFRKVYID